MGSDYSSFKNGDSEFFYTHSKKLHHSTHKLEDGTYKTVVYDQSSKIKRILLHIKRYDLRNGRCLEYDTQTSKLLNIVEFTDDTANGPYELYDEKGVIIESGCMRNGIYHGIRIVYKDGVKHEINYECGIKHGDYNCYRSNKLIQTMKFSYGILLETIVHKPRNKPVYPQPFNSLSIQEKDIGKHVSEYGMNMIEMT